MRSIIITIALISLLQQSLFSQELYFPPLIGNNWETLSPDSLGWCEEGLVDFYDFLEEKNTKAFIVLKDGKIVVEEYFGDTDSSSNLQWNSAGKGLTALMVGIAQDEGLLSITDKTSDYLGEGWTSLSPEKEALITVEHQLMMTTGMDDTGFNFNCVEPSCLTYLADAGTRWSYHNGPYTLLTNVVEAATGATFNNYLFQKVKLFTGINGLSVSLPGNFKIFFSTPRSMARFGLLISNKANWDGRAVLSDSTYYNQMIHPSQDINQSYGYLWWLNGYNSYILPQSQDINSGYISPSAPADLYAAIGKDGQFLDIVPSQGLVVVRMGGAPDSNAAVPIDFHDEMWLKIADLMCDPATSVSSPSDPASIQVFPNPFVNELTIKGEGGLKSIRLYNSLGQLMYEGTQSSLATGNWPTGVYLMALVDRDGNKQVRKLIKN